MIYGRNNRQASLALFSTYQLSYDKKQVVPSMVREKLDLVLDLDISKLWTQVLQDWIGYYQRRMPMAMENLARVQYRDTLGYQRIRSGAYKPQLQRLKVGDYTYLRREAPRTLDV